MSTIETVLDRIQDSLITGESEAVETDRFELKLCPATSSDWKQIAKSANAFLNTRGGIIILGVSEQQDGNGKHYVFNGYCEDAEPKIKELATRFKDLQGRQLNLANSFPEPEIRDFHTGRIALVYVDELPADEKFCFFEGEAYKRVLTGDHKLLEPEIKEQEKYKQESALQNELRLIDGTSLDDIDLESSKRIYSAVKSAGENHDSEA